MGTCCGEVSVNDGMSKTIQERIGQFVATELAFDETLLGERDTQVLKKLVEAAHRHSEPSCDHHHQGHTARYPQGDRHLSRGARAAME